MFSFKFSKKKKKLRVRFLQYNVSVYKRFLARYVNSRMLLCTKCFLQDMCLSKILFKTVTPSRFIVCYGHQKGGNIRAWLAIVIIISTL